MHRSVAFEDEDKRLILTKKEKGGLRVRLIRHGKNGLVENFYLTEDERLELLRFLFSDGYEPQATATWK